MDESTDLCHTKSNAYLQTKIVQKKFRIFTRDSRWRYLQTKCAVDQYGGFDGVHWNDGARAMTGKNIGLSGSYAKRRNKTCRMLHCDLSLQLKDNGQGLQNY